MDSLIPLLLQYGYFILFPIAVFEGPIATVIAGFLVSLGIFNFFLVYAVVVIADIAGDALCYALGRWGGRPLVHRFGSYVGITEERLGKARGYFYSHHYRALLFSKIFHGIGVAGLFAAGSLHVPYRKYFTVCSLVSVIQSLILLIVGVLFGKAYVQIGRELNYFAATATIAIVGVGAFLILRKWKRTDP